MTEKKTLLKRGPKVLTGSDRTLGILIRPSLHVISKKTNMPLKRINTLMETKKGQKIIMSNFRAVIYRSFDLGEE